MSNLEARVCKLEKFFQSVFESAEATRLANEKAMKSLYPASKEDINTHNIKMMGDYIVGIDKAIREFHKQSERSTCNND